MIEEARPGCAGTSPDPCSRGGLLRRTAADCDGLLDVGELPRVLVQALPGHSQDSQPADEQSRILNGVGYGVARGTDRRPCGVRVGAIVEVQSQHLERDETRADAKDLITWD